MTENEVFEHISNLAGDYKCFDEKISHRESLILCNLIEEIQQYRAICTVEGYEKAIQATTKYYLLMKEYKSKVQDFEAIGTIEEFKALKDKNEPKKPRFYAHNYYCTECGNLVGNNEFEWQRFLYCDKCGQKLDWQ